MTEIQKIIQGNLPVRETKTGVPMDNKQTREKVPISFAETIKNFLETVNESQAEAVGKVSDVINGKSENLADVMTSLEESRLNFQLMLEIRNKLLESYQEIQRMQV